MDDTAKATSAAALFQGERRKVAEAVIVSLLFMAATAAMAAVVLITVYIWREGWPILAKVGPLRFILGRQWNPGAGVYGILPQLAGSVYVTAGALALGVPFGVGGALFLAEFAPARLAEFFRPAVSLLAAIPSVVYGFVAMNLLLPILMGPTGGCGLSMLAGSIVLAVMILPTIVGISEDAIRAVPRDYKEASLGLGASHWQTCWRVVLPAARSGILAAVILGAGRAIGETMAVMMVTGNVYMIPTSFLRPGSTLTGTIALEFSYAGPEHQRALFAVGIVLFIFIMIANSLAQLAARLTRKGVGR